MIDVSDAVLSCGNRTDQSANNTSTTANQPAWKYTAKQLDAIKSTAVPALLKATGIVEDPEHRELRRILNDVGEQIGKHPAVRRLLDMKKCLTDAEERHRDAQSRLEHTKRTAQDDLRNALVNPTFEVSERDEVRQQVHASIREAQQAVDDALNELNLVRSALDEVRPPAVAIFGSVAQKGIQAAQKKLLANFDAHEVLQLLCSRELHGALQTLVNVTTLVTQLKDAESQIGLINHSPPGEAWDAMLMRELTSGRGVSFSVLGEALPKL